MGEPAFKCRDDRCLGWRRQVHAGQPLAPRDGCRKFIVPAELIFGWSFYRQGDYRATGAIIGLPYLLGMKAEALHLADRTSEALEAIKEAEALVERYEDRFWCAELHRLRGVFLAALGADETQIEASFGEAIRIAKEQKSVSLEKRAEATYAKYRMQKASGSGGRGFRLPLW